MEARDVPKLQVLWDDLVFAERSLRISVMRTFRLGRLRSTTAELLMRQFDAMVGKVGVRADYNLCMRNFADLFALEVGFPCEVVERVLDTNSFTRPVRYKIKSRRQLLRLIKRMLFLGRRISVLKVLNNQTKIVLH